MRKFNTLRLTEAVVWVATAAAGLALLLALAGLAGPAAAAKGVQPQPGNTGSWRLIGQTHADHGADHDTIIVKGPYDNGAPDKIEIRQNIAQGGESRVIDLRGVGKRSIGRIDFWYDTQGLLKGKAYVTMFGMK